MRAPAVAAAVAVGANSNSTPNISQQQDRFEHNREKSSRGSKIAPAPIKISHLQKFVSTTEAWLLPVEIFQI